MEEDLINIRTVEVNRNPLWKELEFATIEKVVGGINLFEYKMVMNTCEDENESIRAILNKRKADEDYNEYMKWWYHEQACLYYIRKNYNDTEDDLEKSFY